MTNKMKLWSRPETPRGQSPERPIMPSEREQMLEEIISDKNKEISKLKKKINKLEQKIK